MDAVNPWRILGLVLLSASALLAAETPADRMLVRYFRQQAAEIQARTLAGIDSLGDWTAQRERQRQAVKKIISTIFPASRTHPPASPR